MRSASLELARQHNSTALSLQKSIPFWYLFNYFAKHSFDTASKSYKIQHSRIGGRYETGLKFFKVMRDRYDPRISRWNARLLEFS